MSVEDLCDYLEEKYRFDVAVLHKEHIEVANREEQIDVSQDPRRHIIDRGRPFYITGTCIEITVPKNFSNMLTAGVSCGITSLFFV
ncbi:MAG: hypothetical protein OXC97_05445 [Candidatus Dadabacteria bacterium]|nr:hypothetical protein [Candidatus Dadabacteria bacterium]